MEEDIKILEDFINNEFQKDKLEMDEKGGFKIGTIYKVAELSPAIENLIKAYKELEEENNELVKNNFKLKNELENKRKEYQETYKDVREEFKELKANNVPTSLIKEKIEHLKSFKGLVMYEKYNYEEVIIHLEELLGEEK